MAPKAAFDVGIKSDKPCRVNCTDGTVGQTVAKPFDQLHHRNKTFPWLFFHVRLEIVRFDIDPPNRRYRRIFLGAATDQCALIIAGYAIYEINSFLKWFIAIILHVHFASKKEKKFSLLLTPWLLPYQKGSNHVYTKAPSISSFWCVSAGYFSLSPTFLQMVRSKFATCATLALVLLRGDITHSQEATTSMEISTFHQPKSARPT